VSASRLHAQSHGLITRVKPYVSEKTWVFRHLRPSFIGSSVLCNTVQRRTMLYKTRYEYRYIYRGPNVFNTEWSGLPGLGDRALEVHRLAGSTPVTRTTNKYIKKITVITVSCGFIFYDRKNYYVNFLEIIR